MTNIGLFKELKQINLNITNEKSKSEQIINQITNQNSQNLQILSELNIVIDKLKLNIIDLNNSLDISVRISILIKNSFIYKLGSLIYL